MRSIPTARWNASLAGKSLSRASRPVWAAMAFSPVSAEHRAPFVRAPTVVAGEFDAVVPEALDLTQRALGIGGGGVAQAPELEV